MSRKTQRYSKEFKAEAVRTVFLKLLFPISEGAFPLSLPEAVYWRDNGQRPVDLR